MSNQHKRPLRAAPAVLSNKFDPWNSSSTGHQRADGRNITAGTAWRDMRARRVNGQFGGKENAAAPSDPGIFDGDGGGGHGQKHSVLAMLNRPGLMATTSTSTSTTPRPAGIFARTVIYINGSTYPLVSDHKLRRILVDNGAELSLHLARRAVTHVILGRPGGGLAGGKLDKEIRRAKTSVKFVDAAWVLESVKAGTRLPEARFANIKIADENQGSVRTVFAAG